MKKLLSIYMIICTLLLFSACGSEKTAPEESTKVVEVTEEVVDISFVTGTYIGNQGSAISVYEDGEAVYYWNGWDEIKSGNKWHYEDGVLTITVDALSCDITAEIGEQITQGDEIIFKSDSINWDNETFKKVYCDFKTLTAEEYCKVIKNTWPEQKTKITSNFTESKNKSIELGGYRFLLPNSFSGLERTEDAYAYGDSKVIVSFFASKNDEVLLMYALLKDQLAENYVKNVFKVTEVQILNHSEVEFGEATGDFYQYIVESGNVGQMKASIVLSYNNETNELFGISAFYDSGDELIGKQRFENIVGSAIKLPFEIHEEETEPETEATQDGQVSPELKDFLDSYEKFIDRYVEFMQEYKKGTNLVGMLADYSKIMTEYMDFASKLEKIDEKSLSTADYAYYLEVTTRTLKKMSEIL